ncbi:MAG: glycosyltransferase [Acidobacteriota bacterium]|nr:glycosyltransferase [Acidobacteriota bacterium]
MNRARPRVSIGLPVRNGENYLRHALDSILSQTYRDFELIISDNDSTDRTPEICREYAARDARIRYYRQPRNLGIYANFNRVFELASGEYFKWAAHDDVLAPDFLARCVEVLDQNPDIILCQTAVKALSADGRVGKSFPTDAERLSSPRRHIRFGYLLGTDRLLMGEYFGVVRSSVLKENISFRSYPGGENPVRAELGLRGKIHVIPEALFFFRLHPEQCYEKHPAINLDAAWFDSRNEGRILFPHWSRLRDYVRSVNRVPMPVGERLLRFLRVGQWIILRWNWVRLILDPVWALFPGLWTPYAKMKMLYFRLTGQSMYPTPR